MVSSCQAPRPHAPCASQTLSAPARQKLAVKAAPLVSRRPSFALLVPQKMPPPPPALVGVDTVWTDWNVPRSPRGRAAPPPPLGVALEATSRDLASCCLERWEAVALITLWSLRQRSCPRVMRAVPAMLHACAQGDEALRLREAIETDDRQEGSKGEIERGY